MPRRWERGAPLRGRDTSSVSLGGHRRARLYRPAMRHGSLSWRILPPEAGFARLWLRVEPSGVGPRLRVREDGHEDDSGGQPQGRLRQDHRRRSRWRRRWPGRGSAWRWPTPTGRSRPRAGSSTGRRAPRRSARSTGPTGRLRRGAEEARLAGDRRPGRADRRAGDAAGGRGGGGDHAGAAVLVRRRFDRAVPQGDRAPEAGAQGQGRGAPDRQPGARRAGRRSGSQAFFAALGQEPLAWIGERAAYAELAEQGSRSSTSRSGPMRRSGRSGRRCWRS